MYIHCSILLLMFIQIVLSLMKHECYVSCSSWALIHRRQTLLWYNQFNGGYDQFVTAGTISSYGILIWRTKMENIDGKNIVISF